MNEAVALRIRVEGLVQGVGFRPFVYRLAKYHSLNGWILNRNDAVVIKIEGQPGPMPAFMDDLRNKAPAAAMIDAITVDNDFPENLQDFRILASQDLSDETSEISPDIAICDDCLTDLKNQPHRLSYPFINCTNCGPRFTIIRDFPYDREKTTMRDFTMCPQCASEYRDISDRRFHAQPIACNKCGPKYILHRGNRKETAFPAILAKVARIVDEGGIIAVKGLGGFHLMCDAGNEKAVMRLRSAKKREGKPFAVMFRNTLSVKQYASLSAAEESLLTSWKRPIVLLTKTAGMAAGVCLGLNTIGAFLPYMAFHYLLFDRLHTDILVLTSGNLAEEPIVIGNEKALDVFSTLADAVLVYNREIFNRADDSVTRFMAGSERVIRRSRGYVPSPVRVSLNVEGILATGAELSNCFCIGKGNRAILSQHIGDLKNAETFDYFSETIERFKDIYRFSPSMMAVDLHPDYLSTRYARERGTECIAVQHHHAHVVACMAEYGLDEPVIGVCFDGTGYGTDGHSWGGEFMVAVIDGFQRQYHFEYLPLPGGDKVISETWRTGISLLYRTWGRDLMNLDIPFVKSIDKKLLERIVEALGKRINTPLSSGCGRLFDGIAAITGLCTRALFHAEAPMRLESVAAEGIGDRYDVDIGKTLCFDNMIRQITADILKQTPLPVMAARFHNSIIWAIFEGVSRISRETGIRKVVLAGGTFQNRYLAEKTLSLLEKHAFKGYLSGRIPCNDGGIALGQILVAGRKRE